MLHLYIWRRFSNPPVFTFLLHVVLECPLCPLLPRGATPSKCLWLQVCGEEFQSADPPAPAAAPWHRVARPFRQAGRMRSCPAWDEVELRINCLLCCWRDDTPQEQRDQAYPYTKKVKQTKKIIGPQPRLLAHSLSFPLYFFFSLSRRTQWPWNHCLYIPFSYFNSSSLHFLTYFSSFAFHKSALKAIDCDFHTPFYLLDSLKSDPSLLRSSHSPTGVTLIPISLPVSLSPLQVWPYS